MSDIGHDDVLNNVQDDIVKEIKPNKYTHLSTLKEQLGESNWADWQKRITAVLRVCQLWKYVEGSVDRPDANIYPKSASNWATNDELAKLIILQNISKSQLQHINQDLTCAEVWKSLVSMHQGTGFRAALAYMRTLYHMSAKEDQDIPEFMNEMKNLIEQINSMNTHFKINDITYAAILAQSLPDSWDNCVDNLLRNVTKGDGFSIVQFRRALKDEYVQRTGRNNAEALIGNAQSNMALTKKKPLGEHISNGSSDNLFCKLCKKRNHSTDDCRHLGKPLCDNCKRFGHMTADCWNDNKRKRDYKDSANHNKDKRPNKKASECRRGRHRR
jgi:hypothetical protein